ncbi:MAG: patatin-like phospholipase family protein [Candidatus Dormibacteraeota bacterium]|nr:patatin-like phospholipase family protein [Candidatus Dormibacteraeota bacterium]
MPFTDLVLEGGGAKGIAHVGALLALEDAGYSFQRVAGTSAGAIASAFTAACMQTGRRIKDIESLLFSGTTPDSIDYGKVPDGPGIPVIAQIVDAARLLTQHGVYPGTYLHDWIHTQLEHLGVTTFGDLKLTGPEWDHLPANERYRLVVVVTDISRGAVARLPWDYRSVYGLDPDRQLVSDAVRASASIPFFFEPVKLPWGGRSRNVSLLVDGGACSDFPVEIFDRLDGDKPRWPTFGVKLSARDDPKRLTNQVSDLVTFATALLETVVNGNDQVHLADPCVVERTMFIDTSAVGSEDFDVTAQEQKLLFNNGEVAARAFLSTWNWTTYLAQCGSDTARLNRALAADGEWGPGWSELSGKPRRRTPRRATRG